MPDALWFTEDEAACRLLAEDPFALLVGFALDQQVTVQQAFLGPLRLKERLGTLEPSAVAKADLEPLFREKPAIHRFPGNMARRVGELADCGGPSGLEPAAVAQCFDEHEVLVAASELDKVER